MTTLAAFPKCKDEAKKINALKDLSFACASSANVIPELQVEIFFLIIGHP